MRILKQIFDNLRFSYYKSLYFKELKSAADSHYETMKEFVIKMGSPALSKMFEIIRNLQRNKFGSHITYEQFLDYFYTSSANDVEMKHWVVNKYGIDTWRLFLRAGGFEEEKPVEISANNDATSSDYAKEIQQHLFDLGCTLTATGHISAMALKHDRSALDQAISFCVGAIAENYFENLIHLTMNGHTHLTTASNKIKNYYENGKISKLAYQSTISVLGSCLNPNKTDEEKEVLESLMKQNYLGNEKLVSITE